MKSVKENKDNITAKCIHPNFPDVKIYANERLTQYNSNLFWLARMAGKQLGFRFVWTTNGKIFMKKDDSSASRGLLISSTDQLRKLDPTKSVNELYK